MARAAGPAGSASLGRNQRLAPCRLDASRTAYRERLHRWVGRVIVLVALLLVVRTWCVRGLLVPMRITGGCMAPHLLGRHVVARCSACGVRFPCDAEHPENAGSIRRLVFCPNCGYSDIPVDGLPVNAGEGIAIHPTIFRLRAPRRWEPVVLRHPDDATRLAIKRVVGLPGESIEIRDGDIFVDGVIQRKGLETQRHMAILVHDAAHPPSAESGIPMRWRGRTPDSKWRFADGRFSRSAAIQGAVVPTTTERSNEDRPIDWLGYTHFVEDFTTAPPRWKPAPITDRCSYNWGISRRIETIRAARDLLLRFRIANVSGHGVLVLKADYGSDAFRVEIDSASTTYRCYHNNKPLDGAAGALPRLLQGATFEFSLIDRQMIFAVDRRSLVVAAFDPGDSLNTPNASPIGIGVQGLDLTIDGLRLYRDVSYGLPVGRPLENARAGTYLTGGHEYFVLGDNPSISVDSRLWASGPGVSADLIVGKPVLVHYPARYQKAGNFVFQVPDPARIRYIE